MKVFLKDIVYAEVYNRKVIIHTRDTNIEYYGKLQELSEIAGADFFRTHRAYLVHFKYVQKYDASNTKGDTSQKLTLMKTSADSLKKSADALNDSSLWEKKKIKKKDEKTGEEIEVEDYDWDKITKAVKSFVEDYNDVVKEAGESNTKDVLRNASWMTGMTDKNSNMLAKIGITIGKGNKLELDEDALKQADISSLKTIFTGYNSFVSKISQKATGISNAANRASETYTNNGTYSKMDSYLTSSKIDKEV